MSKSEVGATQEKKALKRYALLRQQNVPQVQAAQAVGLLPTEGNPHTLSSKASRYELRNKDEIVTIMEEKRKLALEHITPQKYKNASLQALVTTAAILTDKIELLEGRATSRNFSINYEVNEDQLNAIIAARSGNLIGQEETPRVLDSHQ